MCSLIPELKDPDEAKAFQRGYALAGLALAGILVVEIIASVWFW
jgi:hypothetical protein